MRIGKHVVNNPSIKLTHIFAKARKKWHWRRSYGNILTNESSSFSHENELIVFFVAVPTDAV
jgi:hypothetical protein